MEDLVSLLELSDFVVLSLALTDETRGIINKEILLKMKPGTVLINIGRGALINEEDLIEVLQQEDSPLQGAALVKKDFLKFFYSNLIIYCINSNRILYCKCFSGCVFRGAASGKLSAVVSGQCAALPTQCRLHRRLQIPQCPFVRSEL